MLFSNSGNICATFGTTVVGNIPALLEHFISVFLALRKIYSILLKNIQLCEHQSIAVKQLSSRIGELSSSSYYSSTKSTRPFTFLWMNHQGSLAPCIAYKITRSACKRSQSLLDHQTHVYQWRNDHLELIQWENDEFWKKNKQTNIFYEHWKMLSGKCEDSKRVFFKWIWIQPNKLNWKEN